ncbi:hypothetical protein N431DRAFT_431186 [Stipitochalara longipes BDJ]|nr:hypothetical protein N431DRAFT_431186 [Stipitochalara longipes BDJ]
MDLNTEDGAGLQEVYQSRHIDGSEIRLLVLRPGDGTAAVACDLITVSLDDNPIYEALSYVWGDASVRTYVELCGQLASVTINLEAALRAFRLKDCDRTIWADALCINQRDICERNDQVRMMGRIYEDAKSCIVWLGEGSKQTDLAIDAMKEFTKDPNPHWIPKTIVISGQAQEVNLEFLKSYFSGLNELFGLPWWFRVWVSFIPLLSTRTLA